MSRFQAFCIPSCPASRTELSDLPDNPNRREIRHAAFSAETSLFRMRVRARTSTPYFQLRGERIFPNLASFRKDHSPRRSPHGALGTYITKPGSSLGQKPHGQMPQDRLSGRCPAGRCPVGKSPGSSLGQMPRSSLGQQPPGSSPRGQQPHRQKPRGLVKRQVYCPGPEHACRAGYCTTISVTSSTSDRRDAVTKQRFSLFSRSRFAFSGSTSAGTDNLATNFSFVK